MLALTGAAAGLGAPVDQPRQARRDPAQGNRVMITRRQSRTSQRSCSCSQVLRPREWQVGRRSSSTTQATRSQHKRCGCGPRRQRGLDDRNQRQRKRMPCAVRLREYGSRSRHQSLWGSRRALGLPGETTSIAGNFIGVRCRHRTAAKRHWCLGVGPAGPAASVARRLRAGIVISGNRGAGVSSPRDACRSWSFEGNFIGTDVTGTRPSPTGALESRAGGTMAGWRSATTSYRGTRGEASPSGFPGRNIHGNSYWDRCLGHPCARQSRHRHMARRVLWAEERNYR